MKPLALAFVPIEMPRARDRFGRRDPNGSVTSYPAREWMLLWQALHPEFRQTRHNKQTKIHLSTKQKYNHFIAECLLCGAVSSLMPKGEVFAPRSWTVTHACWEGRVRPYDWAYSSILCQIHKGKDDCDTVEDIARACAHLERKKLREQGKLP